LNLDERLEKLAARHEALARSLEILTHDVETLKGTVREQNPGVMSILQGLIDVVGATRTGSAAWRAGPPRRAVVVGDPTRLTHSGQPF